MSSPVGSANFKRRLKAFLPWAVAFFAGFFLWSAYPPWEETGNAWFALAPLLIVIRHRDPRRSFWMGTLSGLAFWAPALSWLWKLRDNGGPFFFVVLGHAALSFYCALYTGVFTALISAAWGRVGLRGDIRDISPWRRLRLEGGVALLAAVLWSGLEWLRSTLLTGFAWNHLGVSQASNRAVLQVASLGGVYLVSALVMLVNASLANTMYRVRDGIRGVRNARRHLDLLFALGLVVVSFLWGAGEIRRWEYRMREAPTIMVGSIQPNAPSIFERQASLEEVDGRLVEQTERIALFRPQLLVWPETTLGGVVPRDAESMEFAFENARRAGCPLLAGAVEVEARPGARPLIANASWLFMPDGRVGGRYRKQHLVPFGEFIPLDRYFPWLERLSPIGYSCTPGTEPGLMELEVRAGETADGRALTDRVIISPLICFEDTVSALARKAVNAGAGVLINQSNDAWFAGSSEGRQHHMQAILRAVETRTPLLRCSNAGESAIVDATGLSGRSSDFFVMPLNARQADWPRSPYTRWGDWLFGLPCALGVLIAAVVCFRRGRPAVAKRLRGERE